MTAILSNLNRFQ